MLTDLEIAQQAKIEKIINIAKKINLRVVFYQICCIVKAYPLNEAW